ncbi:MAG: diaminopimelate epimerase [Clostridiales bacterium]|jgi:diaminopimelate epimerase|nr:diaminopimelate epimerase [Clostridiales bacterium]
MKFTKMHGTGNDYIYIDCFEEKVDNPEELAVLLSNRNFGIGADGLILIQPSEKYDCFMDMYNADGSRGKMCGNGIRCVGKYIYEHGIARRDTVTVDTLSGIKTLSLDIDGDRVTSVTVEMGAPILEASLIPTTLRESGSIVDMPVRLPGLYDSEGSRYIGHDVSDLGICPMELSMTCVSMGNPHAVIVVDDPLKFPVRRIGSYLEKHPSFPEGVNVQFISIQDENNITIRTWERGSGETLSCGTGNCAALVAATLLGKSNGEADMKALGGILHIRWDRTTNIVYLTGGAEEVFTGEIDVERISLPK